MAVVVNDEFEYAALAQASYSTVQAGISGKAELRRRTARWQYEVCTTLTVRSEEASGACARVDPIGPHIHPALLRQVNLPL
jgi:hypothetical protein